MLLQSLVTVNVVSSERLVQHVPEHTSHSRILLSWRTLVRHDIKRLCQRNFWRWK